jgi:phosphoenolpyruvate synthase/pyruvate phosphate dikinase
MIAAAFWPKNVIVRLSDFKTNEYGGLLGGAAFEPKEENPMLASAARRAITTSRKVREVMAAHGLVQGERGDLRHVRDSEQRDVGG